MKLVEANGDFWYDFGDNPNEKARQFMMEHLGFDSALHLSDNELEELDYKFSCIQVDLEIERGSEPGHKNPYSEYGRMMMGAQEYFSRQLNPEDNN